MSEKTNPLRQKSSRTNPGKVKNARPRGARLKARPGRETPETDPSAEPQAPASVENPSGLQPALSPAQTSGQAPPSNGRCATALLKTRPRDNGTNSTGSLKPYLVISAPRPRSSKPRKAVFPTCTANYPIWKAAPTPTGLPGEQSSDGAHPGFFPSKAPEDWRSPRRFALLPRRLKARRRLGVRRPLAALPAQRLTCARPDGSAHS